MKFVKSIKQSIEILKLNAKEIEKVAKDKQATTAGILILIIGGIIGGIASRRWALLGLTPIMVLIFSFVGIGILHMIAKLFGGKAQFMELYRTLSHAYILNWLSIFNLIPILKTVISIITGIWGLVINFVAIKSLYKLSTAKTVFVIVIPIIFFMILAIIGVIIFMVLNPEALSGATPWIQ